MNQAKVPASVTKPASSFTVYSGAIFGTLLFAGLIMAGFFPPIGAYSTSAEVSYHYNSNKLLILFGMTLPIFSATLLVPFYSMIAEQMKKMEGCPDRLIYALLILAGVVVVFFMLPFLFWLVAAYRPERDPELTLLLNDMASLFLIPPIGPFTMMNFVIGLAILRDRRSDPVFPRYVGYVNIWVGTVFLVDQIAPFFRTGPFAWNGTVTFYFPAVAQGVFLIVMTYHLRRLARIDRAAYDAAISSTETKPADIVQPA